MDAKQPTGIVAKIVNFLKLGDEGKIGSFIEKQVKMLNRTIQGHKNNIEQLKFKSEKELEDLNEKLQDAQEERENSLLNINPEDVDTNAKQEEFSSTYWGRYERTESKIQDLNEQIKNKKESTAKSIETTEKQISELQYRIKQLS